MKSSKNIILLWRKPYELFTSFTCFVRRIFILFILGCALTHAATFTVTNTNDTGAGSLRAAVANANSNPGFDSVNFQLAAGDDVITLSETLGRIIIEDIIEIQGPGSDQLTIDGGEATQIFFIDDANALISGLTITRGLASGTNGGAIKSEGGSRTLTLVDCAITDSKSDGAGGGVLAQGDVIIERCTVSGNEAGLNGFATSGGGVRGLDVTIRNSTISNNTIARRADGGGVYAKSELIVEDSIISGNGALGPLSGGGGLYSDIEIIVRRSTVINNRSGQLGGALRGGNITITDSTFSENSAPFGGVLYVFLSGQTVTAINSTFSENSADTSGGAIYINSSPLFCAFCTVVSNTAGQDGGGFYFVNGGNDRIVIQNSAFTQNRALTGNADDMFLEDSQDIDVVRTTHNFISDDSTTGLIDSVNGNIINVTEIQLGAIQDNGGPTLTHEPLSGSRLINAGDNQVVTELDLLNDQRGDGFSRIKETTVDIGAIEFGEIPLEPEIFRDGFEISAANR